MAIDVDKLEAPVYWHDAEPDRLRRDLAEVSRFAPGLAFRAGPGEGPGIHHGVWSGHLPIWPFDRPEPPGLNGLVHEGLACEVYCSAAHPMLPPRVYPTAPLPQVIERSQHTWHVAPDGSLCLMQSLGDWEPETSIVELLQKACGWRIEYALMKAGAMESMSLSGIVSDDSLDHLIGAAKATVGSSDAPPAGAPVEQEEADGDHAADPEDQQ